MQFGEIQLRTGERLRRLFEILLPHADGLPRDVAIARLLEAMPLSPHEAGHYSSSGLPRITALLGFGTAACVKAGWMSKDQRLWRVTPEGERAFHEFSDPLVFIRTATRIRNARQRRQRAAAAAPALPAQVTEKAALAPAVSVQARPDTRPSSAATASQCAWSEIRAHIQRLGPYGFQELAADLLRALGWFVAWIAPPGKDGGVDLVAFRDPLGATARRLKVQVTMSDRQVDLPRLRSFIALLHEDDIGLFVSACGFTRDAEEFARVQARRRVTLLDVEGLVDLWGQHYAKLDDSARRRLPLQPVWWLAGEEDDRAERSRR